MASANTLFVVHLLEFSKVALPLLLRLVFNLKGNKYSAHHTVIADGGGEFNNGVLAEEIVKLGKCFVLYSNVLRTLVGIS